MGQHNQFAARHLSLRALVCLAAHEHVVAHGEAAEMFEIVGEMPGQSILAANAALLVDGGDEGDQHKQDEGFIRKAIIVRKRGDSRLASSGGWLRLALVAMTVKKSNRYLSLDMRVRLVIEQSEIFVIEIE